MDFNLSDITHREKADVLILPFWKTSGSVEYAAEARDGLTGRLSKVLESGDFKGKEGETFYFFDDELIEKRLIFIGLGMKDKISAERLRCAYANVMKICMSKNRSALNIVLPTIEKLSREEMLSGIADGLLLVNYKFNAPKKNDEEQSFPVEKINWLEATANDLKVLNRLLLTSKGVYLTRDLVNGNADEVTPEYLKSCAVGLSLSHPEVITTIFDKERLEKEHLDLLLAVSRGSHLDPFLIISDYKGDPDSKEHVVLVGKGVTYDTGGLNLKPTGSMETMKCDMAGAAACLGAMEAVVALKLKVNFTIVIPSTENGIDAKSFKPGDVYNSYSGKTVEVTNTDAEGRLILADALAYVSKNFKPTYIIDIATLTGAIDVALGAEASGLMSTSDRLAGALIEAGERTGERLWRMPLYDEYRERLKSDFADLKSWNGRGAGANVAATFLRQFVDENIAWAHIDIASTAYASEAKKYLPKYASGVGVRLIVNFLENFNRI